MPARSENVVEINNNAIVQAGIPKTILTLKDNKMKKLFIFFMAGLSLAACNTSDKKLSAEKQSEQNTKDSIAKSEADKAIKDTANFTSILWLDSTYLDLGKVKEGKQVDVAFRFTNNGTKNLVIADVTASCGCTVPEKPEKAFAPGEEGVIKARFDSRDKHGEVRKMVYVTANTLPNPQELTFRVEITDNK